MKILIDLINAIYDYALANDFRFLSYGDSSILLNSKFKIQDSKLDSEG